MSTEGTLSVDYENGTGREAFDLKGKALEVLERGLSLEGCPWPAEISLLITDGPGIRSYNKSTRGIDEETDVLSYPAVEFGKPSDFSGIRENDPALFDLDEEPPRLILGDILVNFDRIAQQAVEMKHSEEYEYSFMIAHSLLHLLGWDHAEPDEEEKMTEETLRIVL